MPLVRYPIFIAAVLGLLIFCAGPKAEAIVAVPLAPAHEYVAIADRPVCDLVTGDANVRGQDGAASLSFLGRVFWGYGDTYVGQSSGAPNQPNSLGYTGDPASDPAGNCVGMQHKRDGSGNATALLPKVSGECGLWPLGMAGLQSPSVHLFYVSVTNCTNYATNGVGLATFDGTSVPGFPAGRRGIVWPGTQALVQGAQTFTGGSTDGNLYIGLPGPSGNPAALPFANTARIARLPSGAASLEACVPETAPACQMTYWDPATSQWAGAVGAGQFVFTAPLGANGGVMFGYNSGLGKWVSTYATGPLFVVRMRTALERTGPWSSEETLLSYCAHFMLPGLGYCYTGYIHPEYETNGGNTMYVTMATQRIPNGVIDEYTVFLHEVTLGKPVLQSVSAANARRYRVGGGGGPPAGYSDEGTAFYASPVATPGFVPVYEWTNSQNGDVLLGAAQPDALHSQQGGAVFYAPPRVTVANYANAYEPVYRWDRSATEHVYSPLLGLEAQGYTNAGIAFFTLCGDTDVDYLSDCAELNAGQSPTSQNGNVDGDLLLDNNGNPVVNAFGFPIPLGNMQSVAQDHRVRRQDIDNCPLVNNPWQDNSDSGPIVTNAPTGPDITRPNADILGDACDSDNDNDLASNAQEAAGCNGSGPTNPTIQDTDGDRVIDSFECAAGSNPSSAVSRPAFWPDADRDQVTDEVETMFGTDSIDPDTDGDGLGDGAELRGWGLDPLRGDTDGDGCDDGREAASLNGDWTVTVADLNIIAARINSTGAQAFDVNRDGAITAADIALAARVFGACTPARHIDRRFSE